jgi:hypothetical protein
MRSNYSWFTNRVSTIWKVSPGRSVLAIVPAGCSESDASAHLAPWIDRHCKPPIASRLDRVIIARVVPDQTMSSVGFVSQISRAFGASFSPSRTEREPVEPSQLFEMLIEELHQKGTYPVLLVERFHSFANVRDNAFLSILSSMRSFEHGGMLTTVALSPIGYDVIRREIAANLPFVNSSYGDNHDRAVMSPLSFTEFREAAEKLDLQSDSIAKLYSLGGGPDVIYQTLLDEAAAGIVDIVPRCLERLGDSLARFLNYAVGPLDQRLPLLVRLSNGIATQSDAAFLRAMAQSQFLVKLEGENIKCAGPILQRYILQYSAQTDDLEDSQRAPQIGALKILIISANSLVSPLDIEAEVRDLLRQMARTLHRDQVEMNHCQAATPDEVVFALRTFVPHIVHFSGHGDETGIELRTEGGGGALVSGASIAKTFQNRSVKLAFFNVCHSSHYASAIARYVDTVITTTDEVDDEAAKLFAVAFYRTIVSGFTVGQAFQDGSNAVDMNGFESVFEIHGNCDVKLLGDAGG